jgi:predicted RecA/RadA family phage recombinase
MNLEQIKTAIAEGKKVYWSSLLYEVIESKGEYLIKCGNHCIGLVWEDGVTLNGKESEFFTK